MCFCSSFRQTPVSIWDQGLSIKKQGNETKVRKRAQQSQRRGLNVDKETNFCDYVNDLEAL